MKQGDFSELAKSYTHRTGYSMKVLGMLARSMGAYSSEGFRVADVGAGTGKLTLDLLSLELNVTAVEPNDAMRAEGILATADHTIQWHAGSAESTGLATASANWLLMGSSFHWVDRKLALPEFHRVLTPGGHLTVLWNPRNIDDNDLHNNIEARIRSIVPELTRVSSGSSRYTENMVSNLQETGHFTDVVFVEDEYEVRMTPERYVGAWRSVNDIQAQAGEERFNQIIDAISQEIAGLDEIAVPYKTRSWTAVRV